MSNSTPKQPAAAAAANQLQQGKRLPNSPFSHSPRVAEHPFFTSMANTEINSVENDLIKLLNEFSDSRLKHGTDELHEKLFKKLDAIRDKQEKIAKIHFEQDKRLAELK